MATFGFCIVKCLVKVKLMRVNLFDVCLLAHAFIELSATALLFVCTAQNAYLKDPPGFNAVAGR